MPGDMTAREAIYLLDGLYPDLEICGKGGLTVRQMQSELWGMDLDGLIPARFDYLLERIEDGGLVSLPGNGAKSMFGLEGLLPPSAIQSRDLSNGYMIRSSLNAPGNEQRLWPLGFAYGIAYEAYFLGYGYLRQGRKILRLELSLPDRLYYGVTPADAVRWGLDNSLAGWYYQPFVNGSIDFDPIRDLMFLRLWGGGYRVRSKELVTRSLRPENRPDFLKTVRDLTVDWLHEVWDKNPLGMVGMKPAPAPLEPGVWVYKDTI